MHEPVGGLVATLLEDQRNRWGHGERVFVEMYLGQFPALQTDPEGVLYLLGNEMLLRERQGEPPTLEEYRQRFPGLATELELHFEVHQALEGDELFQTLPGATAPPHHTTERQEGISPGAEVRRPEIPGYEILEELGRGGMGVVYKARQIKLKRLVAVKMILAGGLAAEQALARFRLEAEAVARLKHPHIVQIHEIGETVTGPFFSMEFVEGGSLARKINGNPLPVWESAQLMEALARAVDVAHRQGILHRDLKPENVLLTAEGQPKITDFGLAKRLDQEQGQTQTGAVMGTPGYMAPEQACGKSKIVPLGPRADVYALGAILYETLTGRPPFRGETNLETLQLVLTEDPVPPSRLQPKVPRDLDTVCLKCLRKDPQKRYASAQQLAEELRRFQVGEPVQARPVGRWERAHRWVRRHPTRATALALAGLALIAVLVTAVVIRGQVWEENQATHAAGLVGRLLDADIAKLPDIIQQMKDYREWTDPLLQEDYARSEKAGKEAKTDAERSRFAARQLRASLALLPADPAQVKYLYARLLDAEPKEVPVIRDALGPHQKALLLKLWTVVAQPPRGKESQRLRAACALATYDPTNLRWQKVSGPVVDLLVAAGTVDPASLGDWMELLRPIKAKLIDPLCTVYRDRNEARAVERNLATNVLKHYAANLPDLLADLLMDADEKQFAVLYPKFKEHPDRGLPLLTSVVERKLAPNAREEVKEKLAKRQANAAVALLRMNQPAKVWPLLKHSPDPRVRSYLIHCFGPLGADAEAIVKRLAEEPDVTIQRALILSLGPEEFGNDALTPEGKKSLVKQLRETYRTAADPGLHAAAEWLLRQWHEEAWLRQTGAAGAKDKERREKQLQGINQELKKASRVASAPGVSRQWYVNSQGQTMVVIPGPVKFVMGSPLTEQGRAPGESQHQKRIGRTFAIAAKPVTVGEYRLFDKSHGGIAHWAPTDDCPVVGTPWDQAAAYCNWLSKQERLPEDQWCYEITGPVMKLKKSYLGLGGYRLPTEAEMEYATRAEAVTSRYYGESAVLLGKYGWFLQNAAERTWPVGSKKPNDLGLFDLHGNAFTWCQEKYKDYPRGEAGKIFDDNEDTLDTNSGDSRLLRGAAFYNPAGYVRSARRNADSAAERNYLVGFRLARTFAP